MMRTSAEVLRRLTQKAELDDEARDMVAFLVYCFRGIADGIDESVRAWEKRNYWIKAERFRERWMWVERAAHDLEEMIHRGAWDRMPELLADLLPHFADIRIARFTRDPSLWKGAYERLVNEHDGDEAR